MTWTERGKDEGDTYSGTGKITYNGTTFAGIIKYKDPEEEMTMRMKGKWIVPCK